MGNVVFATGITCRWAACRWAVVLEGFAWPDSTVKSTHSLTLYGIPLLCKLCLCVDSLNGHQNSTLV